MSPFELLSKVLVIGISIPLVITAAPTAAHRGTYLPIVDLGYERHQASYNATGQYYNFTNVRYAAPPFGNLRFSAPVAPFTVTEEINDGGTVPVQCVQAIPYWVIFGEEWLTNGIQTVDVDAGYMPPNFTTLPPAGAGVSEDCLFLDVLVPEIIFNQAGLPGYSGAPVLVWIHGGGEDLGYKTEYGGGAGLLAASQTNGKEGVIYVAINYRLGLFGWLSGPTFQENGTANAGLLDQRFALEWIQSYIPRFGGDLNRVTVMGESAGGASIMHQITAYGGMKGPVPFQQAILQSAAWLPSPSPSIQESIFQSFLATAGVSTLQEARGLSTEALQLVNYKMVGEAPYGDWLFSKVSRSLNITTTNYITDPGIDGSFVPQLPGQLLLHGGYDQSLKVMAGHQVNEGFALTTAFLPNDEAFKENIILVSFNDASNNTIDLLMNTYYPAQADGQFDLLGQLSRGRDLVTEALFTCNANYITRAFGANAYSYVFSVPPSIHAQVLPYTFFNGPEPVGESVENATLALIMQDYFTNFAITGDPNGASLPYFPDYSGGMSQNLNLTFINQIPDYLTNERCLWWQKALYY